MASNDSTAPLGLPGTLRMRDRPRTPTTPRDRSASGVLRPADGPHRLGQTGDLVVDDGLGGLWGHVAWRQSGATGRDDEGVAAGGLDEGSLDRPLLVGDSRARSTGEALGWSRRFPRTRTGSVLADAGRDPIADRDHERRSEAVGSLTDGSPVALALRALPDRRLARRGAALRRRALWAAPGGSTSRLLPPVLDTRRTPRISTPRSTPLTMS